MFRSKLSSMSRSRIPLLSASAFSTGVMEVEGCEASGTEDFKSGSAGDSSFSAISSRLCNREVRIAETQIANNTKN